MAHSNLEGRIKIGLDEERMLVLVIQVLLGFQFRAVFQPGFARISPTGRASELIAILLLLLTLALVLMVPARHRFVEHGSDSEAFSTFLTRTMDFILLPFAFGLAASCFVVLENVLGRFGSALFSGASALMALLFWYLLPGIRRFTNPHLRRTPMKTSSQPTPLAKRIDQVLTEGRVVLPGTQALLGFQLIGFFSNGFEKLPRNLQLIHCVALGFLVISAILLMAPPAYHRIGENGADTEQLLSVTNRCLVWAMLALAIGISLDFVITCSLLTDSESKAIGFGIVVFVMFLFCWFAFPWFLGKAKRKR